MESLRTSAWNSSPSLPCFQESKSRVACQPGNRASVARPIEHWPRSATPRRSEPTPEMIESLSKGSVCSREPMSGSGKDELLSRGIVVRRLTPFVAMLVSFGVAGSMVACGGAAKPEHNTSSTPVRVKAEGAGNPHSRSDRSIARAALLTLSELGTDWRQGPVGTSQRCPVKERALNSVRAKVSSAFRLDRNVLQQTVTVFANKQAATLRSWNHPRLCIVFIRNFTTASKRRLALPSDQSEQSAWKKRRSRRVRHARPRPSMLWFRPPST
jgi:hypothetical protein